MLTWLKTAIDTYVWHPLHGNGYQWWSGLGSDLTYAGIGYATYRKHNCYEHRCWRIGTHKSQLDQHVRCRKHHLAHKAVSPTYPEHERIRTD